MMIERVVQFGAVANLTGVLTEPAADRAVAGVPPVVLINSGIIHKVGSCRLYVKLARALAERGVPSLRFDLSGLGDSDVRKDALAFEESAVAETQEAMDYLTRLRGWTSFQLAGLCSGADVAHMTAVVDPRVVAMGSIDARTHVTPGYWWHNYKPKLFKPQFWVSRLRQSAGVEKAPEWTGGPEDPAFEVPTYVRVIPPRDELAAELRTIASRRVNLLYVFTDGLDFYNHGGQHRNAFRDVPFGDSMTECHLRGADHILSSPPMQQRAIELHVQWALATRAPAAGSAPASAPVPELAMSGAHGTA
jgi:alpha/beta superfamily hydrolase